MRLNGTLKKLMNFDEYLHEKSVLVRNELEKWKLQFQGDKQFWIVELTSLSLKTILFGKLEVDKNELKQKEANQ